MGNKTNCELDRLDYVSLSIIKKLEHIGVYQFCKLNYLFEFLYIKNFGERYTGEEFIKLPHGPVVSNYKKRIEKLSKLGLISTDISKLKEFRKIDEEGNEIIPIYAKSAIFDCHVQDKFASSLLDQVLKKYGSYTCGELEKVVYSTSPVVNYVSSSFSKKIGGKILVSPYIALKTYRNNPFASGLKMASDHVKKYPKVIPEVQKKVYDELCYLEKMRPSYE